MRKLLVAGDIGGTNARLALYDASMASDPTQQACVHRASYRNDDFEQFHDLVHTFLRESGVALVGGGDVIVSVCFAVAGPVTGDRVDFTNRKQWILDAAELRDALSVRQARFVNDFVANGYGLLTLDERNECYLLQAGEPVAGAPMACVGAGTGLGECYLTPSATASSESPAGGTRQQQSSNALDADHDSGAPASSLQFGYDAYPTEGGHVEFAPTTELETDMLFFLQHKFSESGNRVSVERIVSGRGLVNVYEFLRQAFPDKVTPRIDEAILAASDGAAAIAKYAYECALCSQAMKIMMDAYGSECGNVALKYLPFGGLYITGGIAPKNLEWLSTGKSDFMERFRSKGRVSPVLARIPVRVVLAEDLGLRGAHVVAARMAASADAEPAAPSRRKRWPSAWLGGGGGGGGGDVRERLDTVVYAIGLSAAVGSFLYTVHAFYQLAQRAA